MAKNFHNMSLDEKYGYLMGMLFRYKAVITDALNDDEESNFSKFLFAIHVAEGAAECFEYLQSVLFLLDLRNSGRI